MDGPGVGHLLEMLGRDIRGDDAERYKAAFAGHVESGNREHGEAVEGADTDAGGVGGGQRESSGGECASSRPGEAAEGAVSSSREKTTLNDAAQDEGTGKEDDTAAAAAAAAEEEEEEDRDINDDDMERYRAALAMRNTGIRDTARQKEAFVGGGTGSGLCLGVGVAEYEEDKAQLPEEEPADLEEKEEEEEEEEDELERYRAALRKRKDVKVRLTMIPPLPPSLPPSLPSPNSPSLYNAKGKHTPHRDVVIVHVPMCVWMRVFVRVCTCARMRLHIEPHCPKVHLQVSGCTFT